MTAHQVEDHQTAFRLQQFRQFLQQRTVRTGPPEKEILHRVEPDALFRLRGESGDRRVKSAVRILIAQKRGIVGAVVRHVEEARPDRRFPGVVLVPCGQQHGQNLHGLHMAGKGVFH